MIDSGLVGRMVRSHLERRCSVLATQSLMQLRILLYTQDPGSYFTEYTLAYED